MKFSIQDYEQRLLIQYYYIINISLAIESIVNYIVEEPLLRSSSVNPRYITLSALIKSNLEDTTEDAQHFTVVFARKTYNITCSLMQQLKLLTFILIFRLSNSETAGGHYHSASGSPNKIVRGRYGSRNPTNNRLEETTYTAGPRG